MEYCLDCGMKLKGRKDKKFCDNYCRNHYNNVLNRDRDAVLKKINNILKRNEAILKRLNQNGVTRLTQNMLIAAGFDFNFFTHQVQAGTGETYNCCYHYGYRIINEEELTVLAFLDIHKQIRNEH